LPSINAQWWWRQTCRCIRDGSLGCLGDCRSTEQAADDTASAATLSRARKDNRQMNTKHLYQLVRSYENLGLSHDAAFERAFTEYKRILQGGAA